MSNKFIGNVNLCRDPEACKLGDKDGARVRVADNTGQKHEARYFTCTFAGIAAEKALRLKQGDKIQVCGQLVIESYKAKKAGKTVKKGQTVTQDAMPYAELVEVIKSPSFYSDAPAEEPATDAEAVDDEPNTDDPLADL